MIAQCHYPMPAFLPPIPLTHLSYHAVLAYHCRISLSATTTRMAMPWQRKHREKDRGGDVVFSHYYACTALQKQGVKSKKGALTIASAEQKRATIPLFLLRTKTRPLITAYSTGAGG